MNNVKTIFDRLTLKFMKQRTLIIYLAIQNILLALVVLVSTNVILSNAITLGHLNYDHVRIFYTFCIAVLFSIPYLVSPVYLSRSINSLYNAHAIDNLIASRVKPSEIVIAAFLRGFTYVVIMISTAIPITGISFYFGGLSIGTILKVYIMILLYTLLSSTVCTCISSSIVDENLSIVISYVINIIILVIAIFVLNAIIWNTPYMALCAVVTIVFSIMLLAFAKNTTIFSI